jgi:hypothetical protein
MFGMLFSSAIAIGGITAHEMEQTRIQENFGSILHIAQNYRE